MLRTMMPLVVGQASRHGAGKGMTQGGDEIALYYVNTTNTTNTTNDVGVSEDDTIHRVPYSVGSSVNCRGLQIPAKFVKYRLCYDS